MSINIHAGVLKAAETQFNRRVFPLLHSTLARDPSYKVVFSGHSLGGGLAMATHLLWHRHIHLSGDEMLRAVPSHLINFAAPVVVHSRIDRMWPSSSRSTVER